MGRFLNADALVSTGGLLGNNMFAYCNNNPENTIDIAGEIPKELDYRASSTYGGGTFGSIIPIPVPYDEIPYDEDTLEDWAIENGYASELQLMEAISDISDGVSHVEDGAKYLFVPCPTVSEDLLGVAIATYGVLQTAGGVVKLIIWAYDQWLEN